MRLDPWTLALQAVNFLVLLFLLQRFLYRPVLAAIAARQAAARALTADLEAQKAQAAALQTDLERRRAAIAKEREDALSSAVQAADAERKALLDGARAEAETTKAQAQAAFERERAQAAESLGRDAARLAAAMTRRLLQGSAGAEVQARLLDLALQDVAALPDEDRRRIAERLAARGRPVQVVTAMPLDEAAEARIASRLGAAMGAEAHPDFEVDPALIAGAEVRFPFTIVRRTWAEELGRIQSELVHDDGAQTFA